MKIFVPNNFLLERQYIIDVILNEFLGLDYQIEIYNEKDYKIVLPNNNKIVIKDYFWGHIDENKGYLHQEYVPRAINYAINDFLFDQHLPVIYGNDAISIVNDQITCHIDIFASSFFMLTRWEEYVCKQKDQYQRFPDNLSLAQKFAFQYRPVVNEYIELLWNLLLKWGLNQNRKKHNFVIVPTHDVDFLLKFNNLSNLAKAIAGDLINLKSPKRAWQTFIDYHKIKCNKKNDPFDTYDFLMDFSDNHGKKSIFYFIPGKLNEKNVHYDIAAQKTTEIVQKIIQRGHHIGMHASFTSFNNLIQMQKELERLKEVTQIPIKESRQDYLRFENPTTWQFLDQIGIETDSTIGFSNTSGFRAGVCYEYPVFDIKQRKKLKLRQRPLIFMEQASKRSFPVLEDFKKHLLNLKETVRRYNGKFVFLWHNNNIRNPYFEEYFKMYNLFFDETHNTRIF